MGSTNAYNSFFIEFNHDLTAVTLSEVFFESISRCNFVATRKQNTGKRNKTKHRKYLKIKDNRKISSNRKGIKSPF